MPSIKEILEAKRAAASVKEAPKPPLEAKEEKQVEVQKPAAPINHQEINAQDFESLYKTFPTVEALKASKYWNVLGLAQRVSYTRTYSQRALKAAQDAHNASRAEEMLLEEQQKKELEAAETKKRENQKHEAFALNIQLNDEQDLAVVYALEGKSFVLTGAAGTGKTTACREIAKAFIERGQLGTHTFKIQGANPPYNKISAPGIAFCSFTRRATANIRRALHKDPSLREKLAHNVTTIHSLLEYEPEFYVDDQGKDRMRFIPKRTAQNPLTCKVIVIEEASMLGLDLWEKLYAAMLPGTIIVFVGDLNQLPPVFGKSIMNYALAQLPVIELKTVYRQALDSGVIVNAHKIIKGETPEENKDCQLVQGTQKVQTPQEKMSRALGNMFFKLWEAKDYDPDQDIILSPWNKQPLGTHNLNNWIAQFLGERREAMVYEVIAGRRKMYLAVGDRVMYEKQDGVISAIRHNADYLGKPAQPAGTDLTRFGMRKMKEAAKHEDFEALLSGYADLNVDEVVDEEKKQQASHVVEVTLDSGEKEYLRALGDYADQVFSLGYCLTVHKAQGCEWRKVYIVLHKDHNIGTFLSRELLYTAVTRAREKLIIISKSFVLAQAVKQQIIKGKTLAEKIQSINSGASNIGQYPVTKPILQQQKRG